ncbi:hypothetical protein JQ543_05020 [Bradyrhizobium diazoefficiens]|nr:hypothetical protein [Bradyrhizobium diazoefficiens]MBR0847102.1 hypothetical protein [Bradyrhizobium diazoefficiens]
MVGEVATIADAGTDAEDGQGRQRSTISFPYADLNSAVALAQAIHGNVGLGDCDDAQLAAWTNQSVKSSTFRVQLAAARLFGLMGTDGAGRHRLTELGRMVVDPNRAKEARARSFLMVPLFKAVFDNYNGMILPPAAALARDMVGLGVAEKTKDRARQVFERSAEQAGFFANGRDRLVMPGLSIGVALPKEDSGKREEAKGGGGGGKDPLIDALIQKLPKAGDQWAADDRITWLQMIAMAFQMTYGSAEKIEIKKVPREG